MNSFLRAYLVRAAAALMVASVAAVGLSACGGGGAPSTAAAGTDLALSASAGLTGGLWSDPGTWGGSKPVAGAAVVIPSGMSVVLDENTPALGELVIEGELTIQPGAAVELQADVVRVRAGGALRAGTADAPFTGHATFTLTATQTNQDISGMGTRGILVSGVGKLQLFGQAPNVAWTHLSSHAAAGAKRLQIADAVDWKAGDQVVVAPTEWYPNIWAEQEVQDASTQTEMRALAANSGQTLTLDKSLTAFKWGRWQYVTDAGMSLTPGVFTKPHPDAVDKLDERAEVGNLSRNIVIQGLDDSLWRDTGYGAQVMVMDLASTLQLDGVELRRVGQAGKVGRYPIHWHLLSYAADGSELGDVSAHFVRNSTVWNSRQRCMVIHGTNGVEISNNICYDIRGHAIFLEDAVERRNVIQGNLVLKVRSPVAALAISEHEKPNMCGAAAGYWLTNPDNTVRNNVAADAQGNGFWLSYPALPVKQDAHVPIRPQNLAHGDFEYNTSHSNGNAGLMLDCAMTDDAGNLALLAYAPTTDDLPYAYTNGLRFTLKGVTTTKNRGGYVNRTVTPDYLQWAAADNLGRAITGSVQYGSTLKQSLLVGKSLNDRQAEPTDVDPPLGVASYHSEMNISDNTFVAFANRGYVLTTNGWDKSSGAFGTDDHYIRPVEKGLWRSTGNRLIGADAGYRALPPHLQSNYTPATNNNWTLAGAMWDPNGYWGTAGRYSVLDTPFLKDASCVPLLARVPAGLSNGLSCAGPYYGVTGFYLNRGLAGETDPYLFKETLDVSRQDASGADIGHWRVEQGYTSNFLGNMRHFAAVKDGIYVLRFPDFAAISGGQSSPRWVSLTLENLLSASDSMLLGVHFDGTIKPSRVFVSANADYPRFGVDSRLLTSASSRAVVAASTGDRYWRDATNNLIWVKLTSLGLDAWKGVTPGSDDDLYRAYTLRIEP